MLEGTGGKAPWFGVPQVGTGAGVGRRGRGDGVWNRAAFGFRESLGTGLSGTPKL